MTESGNTTAEQEKRPQAVRQTGRQHNNRTGEANTTSKTNRQATQQQQDPQEHETRVQEKAGDRQWIGNI